MQTNLLAGKLPFGENKKEKKNKTEKAEKRERMRMFQQINRKNVLSPFILSLEPLDFSLKVVSETHS